MNKLCQDKRFLGFLGGIFRNMSNPLFGDEYLYYSSINLCFLHNARIDLILNCNI